MRILHIITSLETGGAEMMLFKIIQSMDRQRFEPYVVSLKDKGTLGARIEALEVPVHCLGLKGLIDLPDSIWRLVQIVRKIRPNLIQGWMYHGNLVASFAGLVTGKSVPVLWNIRQSLADLANEKRQTAWLIRIGARLSYNPNKILYNSYVAARQHEALGYRPDKSEVIPNGFDTLNFKPANKENLTLRNRLGLNADAKLIGLVARFHPMKDHINFLRAASIILQKYPEANFLLIGKGLDLSVLQKLNHL